LHEQAHHFAEFFEQDWNANRRFRMRHPLNACLIACWVAALSPAAVLADDVANLLEVCSNTKTPPLEAYNACARVAGEGRLDAKRRALVWMNAGIAAHTLGRFDAAVDALGQAIDADPRLGAAYVNRALAQEKRNNLNQALADFATAISLEPTNPEA
jgi:tetratricopeptide (TPR) repeat protein